MVVTVERVGEEFLNVYFWERLDASTPLIVRNIDYYITIYELLLTMYQYFYNNS